MKISVIIPTLNASKYIKKQLVCIKSQTLSPEEIIVIDSSSTDDTCKIAREEGVEPIVIKREEFSHSRTRNYAASIAKGDIVIFFSQDAIPYNNLLFEHLVKNLIKDAKIAGTYARHIPNKKAKPTEIAARYVNYPDVFMEKDLKLVPHMGAKTFFFSNVCSAIKKDIFLKLGGFREDVIISEDTVFAAYAIKNGYKIVYVPEAMVLHSHDFSPYEYLKRYYLIGKSLGVHRWIIENDRLKKEGQKIVGEQLKYMVKTKKIHWLPYMAIENICKYIGFKAGLMFSSKKHDN